MNRPVSPFLAAGCLALCACGNSNNNSTLALSGEIRVVNGIPDSQGLTASIDNVQLASGTTFRQASGINSAVPEGGYNAQFTTSGSSGGGFTVDNVQVQQNTLNTVFTAGTAQQNTLQGFPAPVPLAAPAAGQFVVQFVNDALVASAAAGLSFYLVAPGTAVGASTTPAAKLAFGAYSAPLSFSAGSYELIVTDSGGGQLYNSGSTGVQFPPDSGNVLQIGGLDDVAPGVLGCALFVTILDNQGNQSNPFNNTVCPA